MGRRSRFSVGSVATYSLCWFIAEAERVIRGNGNEIAQGDDAGNMHNEQNSFYHLVCGSIQNSL